ncbi:MAG: TolC family protein [Candidatus Brocadiia bacterium]
MTRKIWGILAAGAILAAGCGTVRNAHRVQDPKNIPPGERTVTAAEIGLTKDTVLPLDKAVEIALKYHPAIQQSRRRLESAQSRFDSAKGSYLPQLDTSLSANAGTGNRTAGSEVNSTDQSHSASLSLSQLIYDFGKTPASVRQAYENWVAAEMSDKSTANNLVYEVKGAYYDLIKQQSLFKVAEETVKQFEKRLEQVKSFAEVGRRTRYDVTKTEVDLAEARLTYIKAINSLKTSRATLNNALGLAEDPGYSVQTPPPPEMSAYTMDEFWQMVKLNNPEMQSQSATEKAASAGVDKAIADLYPSLSLNSSYSWSGGVFPMPWNWSVGAAMRFNIFQGFQKVNAINEAVDSLRQMRSAKAELEQRLFLDLNRAYAQLEDSRQRLAITELSVKIAEENLMIVEGRYQVGKASSVELTDAQVSLASARSNRVQADFDYQLAIAQIKKNTGGK